MFWKLKNRLWYKPHIIKPRMLDAGQYYDQDSRLFHATMEMVCDYVEEEVCLCKAITLNCEWHERYAEVDENCGFADDFPRRLKADKDIQAVYEWYIKADHWSWSNEEEYEDKQDWAMNIIHRNWRTLWV